MSPKDRQKAILVALLLVGAAIAFWYMWPAPDDAYRKNFEAAQQQAAQQPPADQPTAVPAAPSRPGPAGQMRTAVTPGASRPAEIDLDSLLASVKEVDFEYAEARIRRDPMRPLVGPMAPPAFGEVAGETQQPQASAEAVARSMMLSGIVYDDQRPLAVVNDQVVSRGHVIAEGIVVEDIEASRVILRVNDNLVPLDLEER